MRTLGIVLLGGLILVATVCLLLLSLCAWQPGFGGGGQPQAGMQYLIAALILLAGGTLLEAWLARGLIRSSASSTALEPAAGDAQPALSGPLHLSHASSELVRRLRLAMGAQIGLSFGLGVAGWLWNGTRDDGVRNFSLPFTLAAFLLVPFVLQHIPYAVLIYRLWAQADRKSLAYALAVPGIALLQVFFGYSAMAYVMVTGRAPLMFLLITDRKSTRLNSSHRH